MQNEETKLNQYLISIIKLNCKRTCGVYSAEIYDEEFYLFDDDRDFEFFINYNGLINQDINSQECKLNVMKIINHNACLILFDDLLVPLKAIEMKALEHNYDGILIETLNNMNIHNKLISRGYTKSETPTWYGSLSSNYLKLLKKAD